MNHASYCELRNLHFKLSNICLPFKLSGSFWFLLALYSMAGNRTSDSVVSYYIPGLRSGQ